MDCKYCGYYILKIYGPGDAVRYIHDLDEDDDINVITRACDAVTGYKPLPERGKIV